MASEMSWHGLFLLFFLLFFGVTMADVRYLDIVNQTQSLIFIEEFEFTKTGHVEVNVSQFSLSSHSDPVTTLNLSRIGFFLAPPSTCVDCVDDDYEDIPNRCFFDPQLSSNYSIKTLYTFDKLSEVFNTSSFNLEFSENYSNSSPVSIDLYFQNCLPELKVSMSIRSAMYTVDETTGRRSYLHANMIDQIWFFSLLFLAYVLLAGIWLSTLRKDKESISNSDKLSSMFWVVLLSIFLKLATLVFDLLHIFYIDRTGDTKSWSFLLALMPGLFTEIPILLVVVFIFTGARNKVSIKVIIFLEIITSIFRTFVINRGPCDMNCYDWLLVLQVLDSALVMRLILYAHEGAIKNLIWGGKADGKAALNLNKKRKSESLISGILMYNVFTLSLALTVSFGFFFEFFLIAVMVRELAALALYIFISYRLWPEVHNQYIPVTDDEEKAAAETLKKMETGMSSSSRDHAYRYLLSPYTR